MAHCELADKCPMGIVISAQWVRSADLTHLVMVALALIMTLPSVVAIDQRAAYRVMEPQLFGLGLPPAGGSFTIQWVGRSFEAWGRWIALI